MPEVDPGLEQLSDAYAIGSTLHVATSLFRWLVSSARASQSASFTGADHHPGSVALRRACVITDDVLQTAHESQTQALVRTSQMLAQGRLGFYKRRGSPPYRLPVGCGICEMRPSVRFMAAPITLSVRPSLLSTSQHPFSLMKIPNSNCRAAQLSARYKVVRSYRSSGLQMRQLWKQFVVELRRRPLRLVVSALLTYSAIWTILES